MTYSKVDILKHPEQILCQIMIVGLALSLCCFYKQTQNSWPFHHNEIRVSNLCHITLWLWVLDVGVPSSNNGVKGKCCTKVKVITDKMRPKLLRNVFCLHNNCCHFVLCNIHQCVPITQGVNTMDFGCKPQSTCVSDSEMAGIKESIKSIMRKCSNICIEGKVNCNDFDG